MTHRFDGMTTAMAPKLLDGGAGAVWAGVLHLKWLKLSLFTKYRVPV
jgi:hypothetical protein